MATQSNPRVSNNSDKSISSSSTIYSKYYESLDATGRNRYDEKLRMLGGVQDPYVSVTMIGEQDSLDWLRWADIEYPNIYNYFIATPGVTKQQLKAYKSMDGYKFFQDGWVSDVMVWSIPAVKSAYLVSCKVKHSQLLSAPPLQPWVAGEKEGCIICAHCN